MEKPFRPLHQILVHVTSVCNFRCKHCYAGNFVHELTLEELTRVFREAGNLKTSLCHLSGGEFFVRKDAITIIDAAKEIFPIVEVTSNGSLLTKEKCRALSGKISKLVISLEWPDSESSDFIRWRGNFDRAVRAIRLAKEEWLNVGVNFTITKKNVHLVPEMIRLSEELSLGFTNFRRFIPTGNGALNAHLRLSPIEYLKLNKLIVEARKRNKTIAMAGDPFRILLDPEFRTKAAFSGCMAGIALLAISPNGDVMPCWYLNLPVWNIRKDALKEIWENSPILEKLRDRGNLEEKCGKCVNKLLCWGCRATAFAETGNLFGNDTLCWLR